MRIIVSKDNQVVSDQQAHRVIIGRKRPENALGMVRSFLRTEEHGGTISGWKPEEWDTLEIVEGEHQALTVRNNVET